ncbi:hypothetical protein BJ322DRAFT_1102499 [Thelephora terrestris]|uniref:Uncharacterized protein n=1 Tax=Thelephora terrestris TaxID=56493 RepID=A0A9P6HQE6_9AGAM|nr:hypothetical protein BJ322DRAFT_1102499 [Thelephora terrestris]
MSSHPNPLRRQGQRDGRIISPPEKDGVAGTYGSLAPVRQPREPPIEPVRGPHPPARRLREPPTTLLRELLTGPIPSQELPANVAPIPLVQEFPTTPVTSPGPLVSRKKKQALPAALSSTLVKSIQPQTIPTNPQAALPHTPFEVFLPDSIPEPKRITGESLQELMLMGDYPSAWLTARATVRRHMDAMDVMNKQKHILDGKSAAEWVSPWATSRNVPADLVSTLCSLVRRDPGTSFMRKYDGDWGTREIMKTICGYHMKKAIDSGKRPPRANYAHAAKNSAKRNPNSLRGPKCRTAASRKARDSNTPTNIAADSNPSPTFDETVDYLHLAARPLATRSQPSPTDGIGRWDDR